MTGARSTFWMCLRAETEPEVYPRYPRLPVVRCSGYDAGAPSTGIERDSTDGG